MRTQRFKVQSPLYEKTLPEILKSRTSSEKKLGFIPHKQKKTIQNITTSNTKELKNQGLSPRLSSGASWIVPQDMNNFEEFKKLNNFYSASEFGDSFLKDFTLEDIVLSPSAGRKDAQLLIGWLDFMLQKVKNEDSDHPDKLFEVTNEIYSACVAEIIKQVASHCKERGYLLARVWKAYQTLFEKTLKISSLKAQVLQETHTSEKDKLHGFYAEKIKNYEEKIKFFETEKNEFLKALKDLKSENEEKTIKENKLLGSIEILQNKYKLIKRELFTIKEDARILKVRYQNIGAESEYNNVIRRLIIPKRFKRKTDEDLQITLNKDPLISDFTNDSDIIKKVFKYGNKNSEKETNNLFNQDDFIERGTETISILKTEQAVQTDVVDLCGETIGVKKRKIVYSYSNNMLKSSKPVFFPDYRPYNQRVLTMEANNLSTNASSELKKKHLRIRKLLSSVKDVIHE